jgi:hypothetical protein
MGDERDQEENEKDEEDDLRDPRCRNCDPGKPEYCSDYGNDKEYDSPIKHSLTSGMLTVAPDQLERHQLKAVSSASARL